MARTFNAVKVLEARVAALVRAGLDESSARDALLDRMAAAANPVDAMYRTYKLEFLITYITQGTPISETELDLLATQAVEDLLAACATNIRKEIGL